MDFNLIIDLFLHLDKHLNVLISQYNVLAYVLIFVVIFIETGLVVTPFLPGDSLIFATAAIAAVGGQIDIPLMLFLLYAAAIGGDTVNYHIGHSLSERVMKKEKIPLVKMEYIEKTNAFFDRHGGKTITIARFVPIVRTFAPFVAGACNMKYRKFISYNIVGGLSWVTLLFGLGYFFGNIEYIKNHFSLVVIAIVLISVLPAVVVFVKNKLAARSGKTGHEET
ncbi:MAG TPA: VTT domain-containing protein [Caproiciproducens sp.]|nr:VTT domain-containing protein [Caproiciproducens sp.]